MNGQRADAQGLHRHRDLTDIVMARDDHDRRGRVDHDFPARFEAIHQRHLDVHGDDVGFERLGHLHGFHAVAGHAGDLEPRIGFDDRPQKVAHRG